MAAAVVAGVFAARGLVAATEEYTAEGLPFAKKGIPNAEIVFAAGRTAANLAAHGGLSEVRYFGAQGIGEAKLFSGSPISVFNQVFRPYASFGGGDQYFLPFNDTSFWPVLRSSGRARLGAGGGGRESGLFAQERPDDVRRAGAA